MKRVPEKELMNDPDQIVAYTENDLEDAYWLFLLCFQKYFPELSLNSAILDIGCGPATIPIQLARRFPNCEIHGVDGARRMLTYGRQAVQREGLENQIKLFHGILPGMLPLPRKHYEVIISNSFLHHLANPMVLWNALHEFGSLNTAVLIIDLIRPVNQEQSQVIVDKYIPESTPLLRQDMFNSLCASFTLDEIEAQLRDAGLAKNLHLTMVSPIQFSVHGKL